MGDSRVHAVKKSVHGFTLVELLVSMGIFVVLLGSMLTIVDGARRAWERGESQVDVCQNGRALLGLIERDLRPALVSDSSYVSYMQFAQDPDMSVLTSGTAGTQVTNSSALVWWACGDPSISELKQTGWFLATPPGNPTATDAFRLYRYSKSVPHAVPYRPVSTTGTSGYAYWEKIFWFANTSIITTGSAANTSVVSNDTVGFWVQCLDANGNAIPELYKKDASAAPLKFNSAAYFQMAPAGGKFEDGTTFHYTATSTTAMGNLLPDSVRIAFLLTDDHTLARFYQTMPPIPAETVPLDLDAINKYGDDLAAKGIQTRLFSTTIKLVNSLKH